MNSQVTEPAAPVTDGGTTAPQPAAVPRGRRLRGRVLPRGVVLSDSAWRGRHLAVLAFLAALTTAVVVWAFATDPTLLNIAEAAGMVVLAAAAAAIPWRHRRAAASAASVAMLVATAILVHLSGGLIEMHFLFFIIVAAVTLYQQWIPFLSAVGFVVLHHGIVGTSFPRATYNHHAAVADPWLWAGIHGGFLALASIVGLAAWRFDELVRDELVAARAEHHMSQALQHSLLTEPQVPAHLEIAVRYVPAGEHVRVGGDWFDAFTVPSGALTIVIGDVMGHDREAAATMAQIRNLLRGVSVTLGEPPAAVLSGVDEALRTLSVETLASALVGQVERTPEQAGRGVVTFLWSCAGHYPPLLLTPDGRATFLDEGTDLLLGVDPDRPRRDHDLEIPAGASLVLYTDGLIERRGVDIHDSLEGLRLRLVDRHGLAPDDVCALLLEHTEAGHDDDIAVLVLRIRDR